MPDATTFENPFTAPEGKDDDAMQDETPPASMSMTKAELLERLHAAEADLTKAEILERIRHLEGDDEDAADEAGPAPSMMAADLPAAETRTATIDGRTYQWTSANEAQVPEAARAVWADAKAAGGD